MTSNVAEVTEGILSVNLGVSKTSKVEGPTKDEMKKKKEERKQGKSDKKCSDPNQNDLSNQMSWVKLEESSTDQNPEDKIPANQNPEDKIPANQNPEDDLEASGSSSQGTSTGTRPK
jgi:hypothetical protein